MNYIEQIRQLNKAIMACKNVRIIDLNALPGSEREKKIAEEQSSFLHSSFIDFYNQLKSYNFKWESKIKNVEKIYGQAKIIEVTKALSDWKGIVYFDDDSPLKNFKIFDQFINEACCGFYTTESKTGSPSLIYFYDYSDEPVSLQLTIEEYIIMMSEARGYLYWQKVLVDHLRKEESLDTKLMKQKLNKVFVDFNFDTFISKFEGLIKSKTA